MNKKQIKRFFLEGKSPTLSIKGILHLNDPVVQTTYIIISLVTVCNPNVKFASATISVNEDILLVENDVKKLT